MLNGCKIHKYYINIVIYLERNLGNLLVVVGVRAVSKWTVNWWKGGFFGNWIERRWDTRCGWARLTAHAVKWGSWWVFEVCTCVSEHFCVSLRGLLQPAAVVCIHLVLLTDGIMHKQTDKFTPSQVVPCYARCNISKASIITEPTCLPTWFNEVCPLERSGLRLLANWIP